MINKNYINFKYELSHFVNGLVDPDETYDQFYEGMMLKIDLDKKPKTIGMFELHTYDLKKSKMFNSYDEVLEILEELSYDKNSRFHKLTELIKDYGEMSIFNLDKVLFLKSVIIHPDYRGQGIFKELIKSIYLTQYNKGSLFIINSAPIQNVSDEFDFHMKQYYINVKNDDGTISNLTTGNYFDLHTLPSADEGYNYKLYAKMQSLNLTQFEDSELFYFMDEKSIIENFNLEQK